MTVTAAWAAAEAQRARGGFEADRLAAELCCDVALHPLLEDRYEAVYDGGAMIGTAEELRASRRAQMLTWIRYGRAVRRA